MSCALPPGEVGLRVRNREGSTLPVFDSLAVAMPLRFQLFELELVIVGIELGVGVGLAACGAKCCHQSAMAKKIARVAIIIAAKTNAMALRDLDADDSDSVAALRNGGWSTAPARSIADIPSDSGFGVTNVSGLKCSPGPEPRSSAVKEFGPLSCCKQVTISSRSSSGVWGRFSRSFSIMLWMSVLT